MQINCVNRQRSFKLFQILLFQLIFTDFTLLKNLETGKNQSPCSQNILSRHYKTLDLLLSENILKLHKLKSKTICITQQLTILNTEGNIFLSLLTYQDSWTKFTLNYSQARSSVPPKIPLLNLLFKS